MFQIKKGIVSEISKIEKQIEKGLEKARKEKEFIVNKGKKDSLQFIADEKEKISLEMKKKIDSKDGELQKEKENISKKGEAELSKLRTKASANKKKTVDFVLNLFEKNI